MKNIYLSAIFMVMGLGLFAQTTNKVTKTILPLNKSLPVVLQENISGGVHQVADLNARDALSANLKQAGMLVMLQNSHATYQWDGTAWRQIQLVRNWEVGAAYFTGDIFLYNGSIMIAKAAGTIAAGDNPLTDTTNWGSTLGGSLGAGKILIGDATGVAQPVALSGDVTLATDGVTTIADSKVSSAKILNETILNEDINNTAAISGTKITPDFGAQTIITSGSITGNNITATGDVTVTGADLTLGDAATAASGKIVLNDAQTTTHTATIAGPDNASASYTLTLPNDQGASGQSLINDGSGNLSWGTALTAGTAANNTIRWDATNSKWVESTALKNDGTDVSASGNITATGDVAVNGGDLTTSATTFNLLNTTVETLNIGGASTATSIGAATGTTTVNNNLTASGNVTAAGDVTVTGADLTLGDAATAASGKIVLNDAQTTAHTATIAGPENASASYTLTLPNDQGASGQSLINDGSGNLSWGTALTAGTAANNTIRWDATNSKWEESTALKNDGTDITTTGDINLNGGDLSTNQTTASLFNTTATTLNIGGASTATSIGAATGITTVNNDLTATGDVTVTGADLTLGDAATAASGKIVLNDAQTTTHTATIAGPDNASASYTLTLPNDQGASGQSLINDGSGKLSWGTALAAGTAANNTIRWDAANSKWVESVALTNDDTDITTTGDINLNGGDLSTTQTTASLFNATATTLNIGGAATTLGIGASSGTTTVKNNLTAVGDVAVNGGDLTTSANAFNLLNTTATTLNIGGASTATSIGAATGTTTVNNNLTASGNITATGDLTVNGGDLTTSATAFNLLNNTATTLNIGGAATTVGIGASTGNTTVKNSLITKGTETVEGATLTLGVPAVATSGKIVLNDASAGTNTVTLAGPATATGSYTLTLPNAQGTVGQSLVNDGSGKLNWAPVGVTDGTAEGNTMRWDNTNLKWVESTALVNNGTDISTAGDLTIKGADLTLGRSNVAASGKIVFNDANSLTGNVATLSGPADVSTSYTLTLPNDQGASGQSLINDGSGNLSWGTALAAGTAANNTLRWDATNSKWVESVALTNDDTDITTTGDINLNGGDLSTTQTTASLFNATATTLNIGGASTATSIGAATGTTTVNNNLTASGNITATGDVTVNGADLTLGNAATATSGKLVLNDASTDLYTVTLAGPSNASENYVLTLPNTQGANGQVLVNDGSGNFIWAMPGGMTSGNAEGNTLRWDNTNTKWVESGALTNNGTDISTTGDITVKGGDLTLGLGTTANSGKIVFHDNSSSNSNTATLAGPASVTASYTLTLPNVAGNAFQLLQNTGSGALGWVNFPASLPSGTSNQTLYYNGSAWTASSALTNNNTDITTTGDINLNGGDLKTTQTIATMFNTTTTNLSIGGAATTLGIGASSGTTTVNNNLTSIGDLVVSGADLTLGVASTAASGKLVLNDAQTTTYAATIAGPANATANYTLTLPNTVGSTNQVLQNTGSGALGWADLPSLPTGAINQTMYYNGSAWTASSALTNNNTDITTSGDINLNGGDLSTNQTTASLFNTGATTLNIGGAATTLGIGGSSGTTTVNNNLTSIGDLVVSGADLTLGVASTAASGKLVLNDAQTTTYAATIAGPANATANYTLTLPNTVGSTNQVLQNTGSGALGWADLPSLPTGAINQTMYYNGSVWEASSALTNNNTDITTSGDINLNGGDLSTNQTTASLFNTGATTLNIGGAATAISIGSTTTTATTTVKNSLKIGSGSPDKFTIGGGNLYVTSAAEFDDAIYADGNVYTASDARLKKNINALTGVLAKLDQMRGVSFEYKDQQKYAKGPQVGLIAQELQQVFPELVTTTADGYLTVNYSQLSAVVLQAVKEQQAEIVALQKQANAQQQQIDELRKMVAKLIK